MKEGKCLTPAELTTWESEAKSARGTERMQMRKQDGTFEGRRAMEGEKGRVGDKK